MLPLPMSVPPLAMIAPPATEPVSSSVPLLTIVFPAKMLVVGSVKTPAPFLVRPPLVFAAKEIVPRLAPLPPPPFNVTVSVSVFA